MPVYVPKVDEEALPIVIQAEQFSAVSYREISATQTIQTVPAVSFVIMEAVQAVVVLRPMAETLIKTVDLAVSHSGHAIQTVHVRHTIILLFLRACLPAMALLLAQALRLIMDLLSGQEWDSINSVKVLML
jgi:hypothetical protein